MPQESERIEALGLSGRLNNALRDLGVVTIGDLRYVTRARLLKTKNLGKVSVQHLEDALRQCGISLADVDDKNAQAGREELGLRVEVKSLREEVGRLRAEVINLREQNTFLSGKVRQLREQNAELKNRPRK